MHRLKHGDIAVIDRPCTLRIVKDNGSLWAIPEGADLVWTSEDAENNRGREHPVDGEQVEPEVLK